MSAKHNQHHNKYFNVVEIFPFLLSSLYCIHYVIMIYLKGFLQYNLWKKCYKTFRKEINFIHLKDVFNLKFKLIFRASKIIIIKRILWEKKTLHIMCFHIADLSDNKT